MCFGRHRVVEVHVLFVFQRLILVPNIVSGKVPGFGGTLEGTYEYSRGRIRCFHYCYVGLRFGFDDLLGYQFLHKRKAVIDTVQKKLILNGKAFLLKVY